LVDFTDVVTEVGNFGLDFGHCLYNNPLDGSLVVVELGFASILPSIKQIKYGGNQSPVVRITSDKPYGPSALAVNFTGINFPIRTALSPLINGILAMELCFANSSHSFTAQLIPNKTLLH
jgi:hypothetical protein